MNPWRFFSRLTQLRQRGGALARVGRAFRVFGPMCADVIRGRYRPIPWAAFGWMVLAVVYLVSPLDLIPDFIMILGLVDDVFVVGWLLTRVDRALTDYRRWKGVEVPEADGER
ncbi:YkvA family protein [Salinicola avicenniae]|uniref:YkvA family protein n=1 Tax=Salinicola avicenniae TaxID=2916836 RepID=UPI002074345F|nr:MULTISPECIES: DUF1232 domain-containing protein [unclassified Salinicola]